MPQSAIRRLGDDWIIQLPEGLAPSALKRLVLRVLAFPKTRRVQLERRSVRLTVDQSYQDPKGVLYRLSLQLSEDDARPSPLWLVSAYDVGTVFRRFRDCVTRLDLTDIAPGRLRLRWPPTALSAQTVLKSLPGIVGVRPRPLGTELFIDYDPHLDHKALIVVLEQRLTPSLTASLAPTAPVPLRWIHANLTLCGASQFFLPPLIPLASVILVLSRLPQIRQALEEARQQKIGTPFFGCMVLACSVAAMTPFASALADWLTSFWERRWREELNRETGLLISALELDPDPARGGPSFWVETGMVSPLEGLVVDGALLVQDGLLHPAIARKRRLYPGMSISLGDRIVAGRAMIRAETLTSPSRLEALIDRIREVPNALATDPILLAEARRVSDQTVSPNLLLALIALSVGGLPMAGAILNQNWHTSPQILSKTEFLQDLRMSLLTGLLVTHPAAYKALADIDVLVIDFDHPALPIRTLCIRHIESKGKALLRTPGWASQLALFMGDARAEAFEQFGANSPSTVTQVSLRHLEPGRIQLSLDGLEVCLRDLDPEDPLQGCVLEIPGESHEVILFESSDTFAMSATVEALRDLGISTWLAGGTGSPEGLIRLGRALGADRLLPGPIREPELRLFERLREEGRRIAFILGGSVSAECLNPQDLQLSSFKDMPEGSRVVGLLTDNFVGLPRAIQSARTHPNRVRESLPASLPTNLLCIVGGFAGAINGIISVLLTHVGVMNVSHHQRTKLRQERYLPPCLETRLALNADRLLTSPEQVSDPSDSCRGDRSTDGGAP